MARQTHFIGLNHRAQGWLKKYCISMSYEQTTNRTYEDGTTKKWVSKGVEIIGQPTTRDIYGFNDEVVYTCQSFALANGSGVVEEYVQSEPWSNGPVTFLALRFIDTRKPIRVSMWSENEINNHLTLLSS